MTSARSAGRPRDESLDTAILSAAIGLVDEHGYAAVTVDAIAKRAHTTKTAIYRRWPKKAAIVMDAFLAAAEPLIQPPPGPSLRDSVIAQMTALADFFQKTGSGRTITGLIAEAQTDPELAEAIRDRWLAPRRGAATAIYAAARDAGELRDDVDVDTLIDAFYGPFYFRLIFGHAPIDEAFIRYTVDVVLDGAAHGGDDA